MREKRAISLKALAGGSASTAKSWEAGSRPHPDKWPAIAERLQLTPSFIFVGQPMSTHDYDFLAKFADEIEGAAEKLAKGHRLEEQEQTPFIVSEGISSEGLRREIEQRHRSLMAEAGDDTARLGWVLEQQKAHLSVPKHWSRHTALGHITPKSATNQPITSSSHGSRSA